MKHSRVTASLLSFLGAGSLALISPVQASVITNGGFESGFAGWTTTGDAVTQGIFTHSLGPDIPPPAGTSQAVLTTGCPGVNVGICQNRNEDQNALQGTYNYTGNTPVTQADPSISADLQTFVGLDSSGLSIPDNITNLLPKEGSAIKQTITSTTPFQISFKWNFLTNDGQNSIFGPSDYGFVTIHSTSAPGTVADVTVLEQSTNQTRTGVGVPVPSGANTGDYSYDPLPYQMFMSGILPAGEYLLGIGVLDGYDRDSTSALLVDQVEKTNLPPPTDVPEPTSTIALLGLGSLGLIFKRKKEQA